MRSSFDSLVLFVPFVVKRFYTSAKALWITISLLQEFRFDKVGDLIRPSGRATFSLVITAIISPSR